MWQVMELAGPWDVVVPGSGNVPRQVWVPREPPVPLGEPVPPAVIYRHQFHLDPDWAAAPGARLEVDGVLGRPQVWLNGRPVALVGAGLVPAAADVSGLLQPGENRLEIQCRGWGDWGEEQALWGAYARPEAVPPGLLPPGLIGSVRLVLFDALLITSVRWQVQLDPPLAPGMPTPRVAHLRCQVRYVAADSFRGRCRLQLSPWGFDGPGVEVVRDVAADQPQGSWELWCSLPEPRLWTVWERGTPHLYRLVARVHPGLHSRPAVAEDGDLSASAAGWCFPAAGAGIGQGVAPPSPLARGWEPSDPDPRRRPVGASGEGEGIWTKPAAPWWEGLVGVRTVERREGVFYLNGEPLFCRGACLVPPHGWPGATEPRRARAWVRRARALGLNALRIYGHRAHPALYEAASRLGLLIWQDVPWIGPAEPSAAARLREQLPGWVDQVGSWPAVGVWAASQEPAAPPPSPDPELPAATPWRRARQVWEGIRWLQGSSRRAVRPIVQELSRLDPSRPVVARAGALSWWRQEGDARLFPVKAAGDAPPDPRRDRDMEGGEPGQPGKPRGAGIGGARQRLWALVGDPSRRLRLVLPAGTLVSSFGVAVGEERLSPARGPAAPEASDRPGGMGSGGASLWEQADWVRSVMESLRRRKLQPAGGGFVYALNGTGRRPCFGLFDPDGRPRPAARAYGDACRPVRLLVDRLPRRLRAGQRFRLPVWVVNDTAAEVAGRWTWELWAGERVIAAQTGSCRVAANGLAPVGWILSRWPAGEPGPVWLRLVLVTAQGEVAVGYRLSSAGSAAMDAAPWEKVRGKVGGRLERQTVGATNPSRPPGGPSCGLAAGSGRPWPTLLGTRRAQPLPGPGDSGVDQRASYLLQTGRAQPLPSPLAQQEGAGTREQGDGLRPFWVLRRQTSLPPH